MRRLALKQRASRIAAVLVCLIGVSMAATALAQEQRPTYDQALVDRWMTELSNWGRWGKDDERGTLNLITPEKRQQAMALARKGVVVSMEQKVVLIPPPPQQVDDTPLAITFYDVHFKTMGPGDQPELAGWTSEVQRYHPHGYGTHVDALCHTSDGKGRLYNGFLLEEWVTPKTGCGKAGLGVWTEGIVTRGILVDMTRLKSARRREPGSPVMVEDIEAWEKQVGVKVSPGDALFVYDPGPVRNGRPTLGGWDLTVLPWMKARGVALTGNFATTPGARLGGQVPGMQSADHRIALVALGMPLLDGPELKPLAEVAARENRWEFLFVMAPVPVPGGTGQIVNPLAMF
jgi:Putative cyclase